MYLIIFFLLVTGAVLPCNRSSYRNFVPILTVALDIQAQFHITASISSLLFTGSTIGFFLGTFVYERIFAFLSSSRLSRFLFCQSQTSTGSGKPTRRRRGGGPRSNGSLASSASQGRYITLVLFSCLHATFFVIMGLRINFGCALLAYVIAAFCRAFLTGEFILLFLGQVGLLT
jgi:hypothetical protein